MEDRCGKRIAEQVPRTELEEARIKIAQLEHELYMAKMGRDLLKKIGRIREERCLSQVRHGNLYCAIRDCHEANGYPVDLCCGILHISRKVYFRWLSGKTFKRQIENERIADLAEQIHTDSPDKGCRRIRDDLERYHDTKISDKRALRICRSRDIKSTIKYANNGCTRNAPDPQYVAENVLNREFHANKPNEKWLTDVTEFKWYEMKDGEWVKHKIYLSAILDLYDRRIVSYIIRNSNDNPLVYDTFDAAVASNPDAHPLFHSDRGFQYTNRVFHAKLEEAGMTQSMSRVAHCIDNGPMEGFWCILKREMYYGNRFTDCETLVKMIENYICYYNTKRLQRNLGILTPMEKHEQFYLAA